MGARANSLLAAVYDGAKWYYGEIIVWNGSRTLRTPYNTALELPRTGRIVTSNCLIMAKIPVYIKNIHISKWPIYATINRLHNKIYLDLSINGAIRSLYIIL